MDLVAPRASLWLVNADAVADADLLRYRDWLTPAELARHGRFVRTQRQRQFIVGRVLSRAALGSLLGVAPQTVQLEERPGMAPSLSTPVPAGTPPGFSIAHSGRWVACAFSAQAALGLDVEVRDASRDLDALAEQAFDDGEAAQWTQICSLPAESRVDGFYRLWSEKEARIKLNRPDGGHCMVLPHAGLSVVLCSDRLLESVPEIELVTLP
jgi:4'-phosphopantetheinyl transferase